MQPDFTVDQADDLAKHFLGPDWHAMEISQNGKSFYELRVNRYKFARFPPIGSFHVGESWREAFRRAGIKLPLRPRFANVGRRVMLGRDEIAACASNSYAERIAKLLNRSERGSTL